MMDILFSAKDGHIWCNHITLTGVVPFTDEEMEVWRQAERDRWEARAAKILNSPYFPVGTDETHSS